MSIDLELRIPKHIIKKEIEDVLIPMGWVVNPKYENCYTWYHMDNYQSIRGVWLYLKYYSSEKKTTTTITTSTSAGRSYEDLFTQNNTLKILKKIYGGYIYNPQTGTRSYITNDIPKLQASEKALGFVYSAFHDNLLKTSIIIEDVPEQILLADSYIAELNKELLRNNMIVPFLVTTLETFLKYTFIRYLETNESARDQVFKKNDKIHFSKLKSLLEGQISISSLETENYNFQNLISANEAFKKYLEIDLFEILNTSKKFNKRIVVLREVITKMLDSRHKFIHEGIIDYKLSRAEMEKYIFCLNSFGELFVDRLLILKNLRIDFKKYI